jgi:hypothetical protein
VPAADTTLDGVAATTTGRTRAHHLNPRDRGSSQDIHNTPFLARFQQPTNITKYSGEMNPELRLDDYRLACQLGGEDNDRFIIRNLSLFLVDSARAWLEHLSARHIHN